jgi:hypothetical protein
MAPLDQRDRDLLARYKASLSPPEDVAQSNWEVIAERVEHEPVPRSRARGVWLGVGVAAALVLASLAGFHASELLRDEPVGHRVMSVDQAAMPRAAEGQASMPAGEVAVERASAANVHGPTPGEAPMTVEARPGELPAVESPTVESVGSMRVDGDPVVEAPATTSQRKRPTSEDRRPPGSSRSVGEEPIDIKAELDVLVRARTALEAEDFARVLALVQRHDREFPQGMMREEIGMLRVGALCKVGPAERWASARSRFENEFPGSPLLAHLREGCFP